MGGPQQLPRASRLYKRTAISGRLLKHDQAIASRTTAWRPFVTNRKNRNIVKLLQKKVHGRTSAHRPARLFSCPPSPKSSCGCAFCYRPLVILGVYLVDLSD